LGGIHMLKQVLIALGALGLCVGAAQAVQSGALAVGRGMPPQQAKMLLKLEAHSQALRRAWLASGHVVETAAPAITAGKLLTPNLNPIKAPAAPAITLTFQADAGLAHIGGCFSSSASSQELCLQDALPPGPPPPTAGNVAIEQPGGEGGSLTLYAAPGAWTLTDLYIVDQSGAATAYNQSQIASLFTGGSTFEVTNTGTPDTAPPVITAARVLTPTVRLSSANPAFGAQLTVSDNLSGVGEICIDVTDPNDNEYSCGYDIPPSPRSGAVNTGTSIAGGPVGTWSILDYDVCDVAGNCVYDDNPSDIQSLFGTTTFKVKD
jgi:hypothetical protein